MIITANVFFMHQHFQPVFTHPSRGGGAPSQPNMGKPGMESESWAADLQDFGWIFFNKRNVSFKSNIWMDMFFEGIFFKDTDTFNRGKPWGGQKSGKYRVLEVFFFFTNQLLKLGQKSCSNASKRYQRGVLMWGPGMGAKIEGSFIGQKVEDVGMPYWFCSILVFVVVSTPLPKFVQLVILG